MGNSLPLLGNSNVVATSPGVGLMVQAGTTAMSAVAAPNFIADGNVFNQGLPAGKYIWNGTTWDRARSAISANGAAGTGVPAAGIMGIDGSSNMRIPVATSLGDAIGTGNIFLYTGAMGSLFNGTAWDRQRNNVSSTLLASAARTVQTDTATQTNFDARGLTIWFNITVASGTGGVQLQFKEVDPVSGTSFTMWQGAVFTTTGLRVYKMYPAIVNTGSSATAISALQTQRTWFVRIAVGDATSNTYSLGLEYTI